MDCNGELKNLLSLIYINRLKTPQKSIFLLWLFSIKLLTIIQILNMTAIIDVNFDKTEYFDQLSSSQFSKIKQNKFQSKIVKESFESQFKNEISLILKENSCKYDIFLTLNPNHSFKVIKIFLLKKCGNILKIDSQQSKTYLIRKFLTIEQVYRPRIDPLTGDVHFRIDYFQFKKYKSFTTSELQKSVLQKIDLDKLLRTIQNFQLIYKDLQQFNQNESHQSCKNYSNHLFKTVACMNTTEFSDILDKIQQKVSQKHSNTTKNHKNLIQEFSKVFNEEKIISAENNLKLISKKIKQMQEDVAGLNTLTKRKNGKTNYDSLIINSSSDKLLKQVIIQMTERNILRTSFKTLDSDLGKITLNLERLDQGTAKAKRMFLSNLPKNTEYHFVDKYFKHEFNCPIVISLSLKEESLPRFLELNSITISLETKMRIMTQICCAVHTMWQEKKIVLILKHFQKIFVTKNLTIKIRNINNFFKAEPHMLLQDKQRINIKLMDNYLNLCQTYFRIFSNFNVYYIRPSFNEFPDPYFSEYSKAVMMMQRNVCTKLLPESFKCPQKELLSGMNFLFLSFVEKARNVTIEPYQRQKDLKRRPVFGEQEGSLANNPDEEDVKLLDLKLTCCWLFKNFQMITKQVF